MRLAALLFVLSPPPPVTTIGVTLDPAGPVTLHWTLPNDPSVVGVTIIRDRLDAFEPNLVASLQGMPASYTDATATVTASYRYWVYTRNAAGELSTGAFVEVIGQGDVVSTGSSSSWWCFAASGSGTPAWPLLAGLAALILLSSGRRCG